MSSGSRFCLALAALMVLLQALPDAPGALMLQREALAQGHWWRLLGAHLVHLGQAHLALNLAGLFLCNELLLRHLRWQDLLALFLACGAAISLALLLAMPGLPGYAGLSGVLHGLWAGAALLLLRRPQHPPLMRAGLACALFALASKLVMEMLAGPSAASALVNGPVITWAHATGAAAGVGWAGLLLLAKRQGLQARLGGALSID